MLGGTNAVKIENRLVQIGELFGEEFKEPLRERVLEVFNQEVEKLLAKKIDKFKGDKGDPAVVDYELIEKNISQVLQAQVIKYEKEASEAIKSDLAKRVADANLLLVEELKKGLSKADDVFKSMLEKDIEIERSINASVSNIQETLQGSLDKVFEETRKTLEKSIEKTQKELSSTAIQEIGLLFEDFKKNFDSSSLKGLDAKFDYDFAKKELASLFEEWKKNLGDLKGEKGEKGEQGEKGKDGAEYPTKETILICSELTQVAAFELKQSNYKALVQITAIGSQGTFLDVELRVLIQNFLGENKILSNTNGASLPINPANLNYSVKIESGLLKVFLSGKAEEQIGVTVVLK
jgi:hypothetical protein